MSKHRKLSIPVYTALLTIAGLGAELRGLYLPWEYSDLVSMEKQDREYSKNGVIDNEANEFIKDYMIGTEKSKQKKVA
jgi:hypothetical protein